MAKPTKRQHEEPVPDMTLDEQPMEVATDEEEIIEEEMKKQADLPWYMDVMTAATAVVWEGGSVLNMHQAVRAAFQGKDKEDQQKKLLEITRLKQAVESAYQTAYEEFASQPR
jgi:phosphate uptake regulator